MIEYKFISHGTITKFQSLCLAAFGRGWRPSGGQPMSTGSNYMLLIERDASNIKEVVLKQKNISTEFR